jgi:hypothetical protein
MAVTKRNLHGPVEVAVLDLFGTLYRRVDADHVPSDGQLAQALTLGLLSSLFQVSTLVALDAAWGGWRCTIDA